MIRLVDVYQGTGVAPGAIEFLYQLIEQRMTEPEVNISATMPTLEQHRQFVHRRPFRCWYLIEVECPVSGAGWVGYVSATQRNEIGVVLLKEHRGQGFGAQAVRTLLDLHQPLPAIPSERRGEWLANINPANEASTALFRSLGFTHIQNTYALPRGEDYGKEEGTEGRARPVR